MTARIGVVFGAIFAVIALSAIFNSHVPRPPTPLKDRTVIYRVHADGTPYFALVEDPGSELMVTAHAAVDGSPFTAGKPISAAFFAAPSTLTEGELDVVHTDSFHNLFTRPPGGGWVVSATTTANPTGSIPSASKAAGAAGVRHVATGVSIIVNAGASAPTATVWHIVLRDGATGAGTIKWQTDIGIQAVAGATNPLTVSFPTGIEGTAATAMTLEAQGNGVANATVSLNLFGYDTN